MPSTPTRRGPRPLLPLGLALSLVLAPPALGALPEVPEGFEVRLLATVPAVQYPSQVATAPDGSLFVAEDPMDQVGPYEAFDGRILRFRDGQDPIRFAEGFRAIQGMAWHEGALYVSHMPFLTIVRDKDGDGQADVKTDLFRDLGPTDNRGLNDHIVSGIQFGMDGYLYISVGDKGVPGATRPEDGTKVQLKGGGTLRCRPDGTGLEVFSHGTRNHLEANLDPRDNLFTYDNTDDGDGWWTRVTHHVDGGYFGYPYDYHGRPDRMLPRMAEYGGGSPCGGVFYKEDAWPERYRGIGLWAEWGKGKVHAFRFAPDGATFQVAEAIDFATPADVSSFKPIDLALSYDGRTLYIADWGMGGWGNKEEKVGRIFAVTCAEEVATRPRGRDEDPMERQLSQLDHPSFNERMRAQTALIRAGADALSLVTQALADASRAPEARRHLVWVLDGIAGGTPEATLPLIERLNDPVPDLRAQAARALGQRRAPIAAGPMLALLEDTDPSVRVQAVIALGRIGDGQAVPALRARLADAETYVAFSARQALRRIGDWTGIAEGLQSDDPKVREGVLLTLEEVYDPGAAETLVRYAREAGRPPAERARALTFAAEVHRKAKPWDGRWWGTRPTQGQPPAKVDEWEGTAPVIGAVREGLSDPEAAVRLAAIEAAAATAEPALRPGLRDRFASDPDPDARRASALALGRLGDREALPGLVAAMAGADVPEPVREAALTAVEAIGGDVATAALIDFLNRPDLPPEREPRILTALGRFKAKQAIGPLLDRLTSPSAPVRAASAGALGRIGVLDGVGPALRTLVKDPDRSVRVAAIEAIGKLDDREAVPALVEASHDEATRFEATRALAAFPDTRAIHVFLRGLADKNPDLRRASARAIRSIREEAAPMLDRLAERKELPPSALPELRRVYTGAVPITEWRILGPLRRDLDPPFPTEGPIDVNATYPGLDDRPLTWTLVKAGDRGMIDLGRLFGGDRLQAFGSAEIQTSEARKAELVVGSDDTLTVWLNGRKVYDFQGDRGFSPDQGRFEVDLSEGTNRVLIRCANSGGGWQFAVAATSPDEYAFLAAPSAGAFDPDAYRDAALASPGDPRRGQELFADLKGLACVKCHAVGGQGGTVGPDLKGVGAKYSRDDLIRSVLYPSAQILSGYEPVVLATSDGRVLTGILKSDTPEAVEIEDAEANRIRIPADEVEERRLSDVSLMPNGLAEGLGKEDFADLIGYLESLRSPPAEAGGGR